MSATLPPADFLPISSPDIGQEEEDLVLQVLRSGQLAQGPMVERLEALCRDMAGSHHAVAVNSGTAALEAALSAAEIGEGDEVVTSPLTFAATLNALLARGAVARFADVLPDFTVDPRSIDSLVNERTKAVIPVHLYGLCADMPAIMRLAAHHSLAVIEDAAQAHGATIGGRRAGSFGTGCFSFYATKNIAAGEGGVVTTDDERVADHVRVLRNQGMRDRYRYDMVGRNLRMTDLVAAVAVPQLQRLSNIVERRETNAQSLRRLLADVPDCKSPQFPRTGCTSGISSRSCFRKALTAIVW